MIENFNPISHGNVRFYTSFLRANNIYEDNISLRSHALVQKWPLLCNLSINK